MQICCVRLPFSFTSSDMKYSLYIANYIDLFVWWFGHAQAVESLWRSGTTLESRFSPSTMWVPRTDHRFYSTQEPLLTEPSHQCQTLRIQIYCFCVSKFYTHS